MSLSIVKVGETGGSRASIRSGGQGSLVSFSEWKCPRSSCMVYVLARVLKPWHWLAKANGELCRYLTQFGHVCVRDQLLKMVLVRWQLLGLILVLVPCISKAPDKSWRAHGERGLGCFFYGSPQRPKYILSTCLLATLLPPPCSTLLSPTSLTSLTSIPHLNTSKAGALPPTRSALESRGCLLGTSEHVESKAG